MLSHNIEIENIENQISIVNEEINAIQNEINESNKKLRFKTIELEQKRSTKISLEKKLNELKLQDSEHSLTGYMSNERIDKIDKAYETNNQIINSNVEKLNDINDKIVSSKSFLTRIDLKIERRKLEKQNKRLNGKNIKLEQKQRMHLVFLRNINKMVNMPQKFVVSVNSVNISKIQKKYENQVERTYELETHQKKLQEEGHKIRSEFFGKAIEFYSKKDEKIRSKYQKLLQTKSELLKLESAKQFYDNYDLTLNQNKVLNGESLSYTDLTSNIVKVDGQNHLKGENGESIGVVPNDVLMEGIKNSIESVNTVERNSVEDHSNTVPTETFKDDMNQFRKYEKITTNQQPENENYINPTLIENSIDGVKNVGLYGKVQVTPKNEMANELNNAVQESGVNESMVQNGNIIKFPTLNTPEYNNLVDEMLNKNNISFEYNENNRLGYFYGIHTLQVPAGASMDEIVGKLKICTELGIKANAVINGIELNNLDSFEKENELRVKNAR